MSDLQSSFSWERSSSARFRDESNCFSMSARISSRSVIRIEAPDRNARRHGDVVRRGLVIAAFAKKLVRRLENLLFCCLASGLAWLSRFAHCIHLARFLW